MSKKEFIKDRLTKKECVNAQRLIKLANWLRDSDDIDYRGSLLDYVKFVTDGANTHILKNNRWVDISVKQLKKLVKDEPGITEYKRRIDNFLENES